MQTPFMLDDTSGSIRCRCVHQDMPEHHDPALQTMGWPRIRHQSDTSDNALYCCSFLYRFMGRDEASLSMALHAM